MFWKKQKKIFYFVLTLFLILSGGDINEKFIISKQGLAQKSKSPKSSTSWVISCWTLENKSSPDSMLKSPAMSYAVFFPSKRNAKGNVSYSQFVGENNTKFIQFMIKNTCMSKTNFMLRIHDIPRIFLRYSCEIPGILNILTTVGQ